jgi:hypothetical protein
MRKTELYRWISLGRISIFDSKRTGAEEGTRTPTPLRVRGPEPRASANSATSARVDPGLTSPNRQYPKSRKTLSYCQMRVSRVLKRPPADTRNCRTAVQSTTPVQPGARPRAVFTREDGPPNPPRPASRPGRSAYCSRRASRWGSPPLHPEPLCRTAPGSRPEPSPWW